MIAIKYLVESSFLYIADRLLIGNPYFYAVAETEDTELFEIFDEKGVFMFNANMAYLNTLEEKDFIVKVSDALPIDSAKQKLDTSFLEERKPYDVGRRYRMLNTPYPIEVVVVSDSNRNPTYMRCRVTAAHDCSLYSVGDMLEFYKTGFELIE